MQLAILCGGLAKRLGTISASTPKALLDINNRPLLDLILEESREAGFDRFVLLAGHLSEKFSGYKSDKIDIIVEKEALGTGGAVINALESLDDKFWVMNGDTYIMASDLKDYVDFSKAKPNSIYCTYEDSFDRDVPLVEKDTVKGFFRSEKGKSWVNVGFFSFTKKDLIHFENKPMNLEKDIISKLASEGKVYAFKGNGKLYDIGRPERLEDFRKTMKEKPFRNKAVLIDRDGTIIEHVPYISDPAHVVIKKDVVERLKQFKEAGYYIILISNQSGIKKGKITKDQHDRVMERINHLLENQGLKLDDVFFCFSTDEDNDPRRKPEPGMIFEARDKFHLNLSRCIMVGDRDDIDMEAGRRAGVGKRYLINGFLKAPKP
ncbi:MAG: HAD-IIIA family hydrolase, partial [Candidatus Micrarchaeota archaeon]|nr:HAD-IIIA family hydrolase [Candidatus Micrarchaeota archaeon]